MSFDLYVSFEFLCAFVPESPLYPDLGNPPKAMTVLLRDLTSPANFVNAPQEVPAPHLAHLQFDKRNRVTAPAPATDRAANDSQGDDHLILFNQEDVTIHPDGQTPTQNALNANTGTPLNSTTPTLTAEWEYLWWAGFMDRVDTTRATVKPDLVQSAGPHTPKLAARILLREGDLFTGRLTPTPWLLSGTVAQRLALSVILKVPCQQFVEFRLTPFGSSTSQTLRLKPIGSQRFVAVFIRNSEDKYKFGDTRTTYGKRDLDFEHYYDLSAAHVPGQARPIPIPVADILGSNGACSPVFFKG